MPRHALHARRRDDELVAHLHDAVENRAGNTVPLPATLNVRSTAYLNSGPRIAAECCNRFRNKKLAKLRHSGPLTPKR